MFSPPICRASSWCGFPSEPTSVCIWWRWLQDQGMNKWICQTRQGYGWLMHSLLQLLLPRKLLSLCVWTHVWACVYICVCVLVCCLCALLCVRTTHGCVSAFEVIILATDGIKILGIIAGVGQYCDHNNIVTWKVSRCECSTGSIGPLYRDCL